MIGNDTDVEVVSIMAWSPSLSVGNVQIDQQHKELSKLGHKAIQLERQNDPSDFFRVLNDIAELSITHFDTEEALLERNGCPTLIEHKEAHKKYVEELLSILDRASQGKQDIGDVGRFVTEIISRHLFEMDIPNKEFMRDDRR